MEHKKEKPKQETSPQISEDSRFIQSWDLQRFFGWLLKLDNIKIMIAIAGLTLSVIAFASRSYNNLVVRNNRTKMQLSESFRTISAIRDSHTNEVGKLREKNTQLSNKVDVLKSESKIFQDSLNACRAKVVGQGNDPI